MGTTRRHGPARRPADAPAERLDRALAALFGISRGAARRAIADGGAYLDGRRCKVASRACDPGAELECHVAEAPAGGGPRDRRAQLRPQVIWSDGRLAVIDKPAGVPTAATRESDRGTVDAWLRERFGCRPHLPQRLDRRASGLLLAVLDPALNAPVAAMFRERRVERVYRAHVVDAPARAEGRLECTLDGKRAALRYRTVDGRELEVRLETGRTHQIRRQLAGIGCPLQGDPRYGGTSGPLRLRAVALAFEHPATGEALRFRAPAADADQTRLSAFRPQ